MSLSGYVSMLCFYVNDTIYIWFITLPASIQSIINEGKLVPNYNLNFYPKKLFKFFYSYVWVIDNWKSPITKH